MLWIPPLMSECFGRHLLTVNAVDLMCTLPKIILFYKKIFLETRKFLELRKSVDMFS